RPRAALGALICVVLALAAMALARARSSSAVLCALLAGPLFLAFKAGYVREDGHVLVFYGFATGAAASIFLGAKTTRPMAIAGITSAIVVSLSLTGLSAGRLLQLEAMGPILAGRQGYTFLQHALHAGDIKRSLDANPVKGLAPDRLPDVELQ